MSQILGKDIDLGVLRDLFYPVGHYWISDSSTNPGTLIGGTWEQVKDTFILAAGDTYTAGSTGGVAKYTLKANIGACNGDYLAANPSPYQQTHNASYVLATSSGGDFTRWNHSTIVTQANSEDGQVTNMPPYVAAYVFKRTA